MGMERNTARKNPCEDRKRTQRVQQKVNDLKNPANPDYKESAEHLPVSAKK
jgi:hypothetical protein